MISEINGARHPKDEMMPVATRREFIARSAQASLLGAVAPAPPVAHAQESSNAVDNELIISPRDAVATAGDKSVRVPVVLSKPTDHTIVIDFQTQNGEGVWGVLPKDSASGRGFFVVATGQLIFQPGEQRKYVEISLIKPMTAAQSFRVLFSDHMGYPLRKYTSKVARVAGGDGQAPTLTFDRVPLPARPSGGTLVFSEDMLTSAFATDSGFRADGTPCWQSRPAHGRTQDGNGELGYYADPALHSEATVWGVGADGRRFIQAEYLKDGLSDGKGGKLALPWKRSETFVYSAAMVTSRTLFNRITIGSYVEFDVQLSKVVGSWPALWLLPANGVWPPEIDVLEAFIRTANYPSDLVFSSVHWGDRKNHQVRSAPVPLSLIEPGADIYARRNRFGCYLGEKQIVYYFNDKPYCAMPNMMGRGPWYMLLNVAVGGIVGRPPDPTAFPAKMTIGGVKVLQHN